MAKVIMFSRKFPADHARAGEPTFFVENVMNGLYMLYADAILDTGSLDHNRLSEIQENVHPYLSELINVQGQKFHTIRPGKRFKKGEYFSPRFWAGTPYRSKQITFFTDTMVQEVYDIKLNLCPRIDNGDVSFLDRVHLHDHYVFKGAHELVKKLAANDGLSEADLCEWFKTDFEGQIIIWHPSIKY